MPFVRIEAGTFNMGSPESDKQRSEEEIQHQVTLTRDFYMGVYEVTRGQFRAFDVSRNELYRQDAWFKQEDNHPVVNVSWIDADAFAKWLTEQDGLAKYGWMYRLPTEAEWEYACRGKATSIYKKYHFGDDPKELAMYGNVAGTKSDEFVFTAPFGKFRPNSFGLYDMHGNVWEWCHDWYGRYPTGSTINPTGPEIGSLRVCRGGSWDSVPQSCRSAHRSKYPPSQRDGRIGFRLVMVPVRSVSLRAIAGNGLVECEMPSRVAP